MERPDAGMNGTVKELWTDALRSGRYMQGSTRLVSVNHSKALSYCCWGVLCELAVQNDIIPPLHLGAYLGKRHAPPQEVYDWADVTWRKPVLWASNDEPPGPRILSYLNDFPVPHTELARLIETQW